MPKVAIKYIQKGCGEMKQKKDRVRFNMLIPLELKEKYAQQARKRGLTLTGWLLNSAAIQYANEKAQEGAAQ